MKTVLSNLLRVSTLLLAFFAAMPLMAATHIVPSPSGGDDTLVIQAELDWADQPGSTIRVVQLQPGTYKVSTLVIGNHTTLEGAGADNTVLLFNPNRPNGSNLLRNRLNTSAAAPYAETSRSGASPSTATRQHNPGHFCRSSR